MNYLLSLSVFLSVSLAFTHGVEQKNLDYMGKYLIVDYAVVDNIFNTSGFTFKVILKNSGPDKIEGSNAGWSLFFNHIRFIEPDNLLVNGHPSINGTLLKDTGLKLYHVNGVLFRLTPGQDFQGISPGGKLLLNLFARDWQIARTDIMPNWYVAGDAQTNPVVLESTKGESLHFVGDFTTVEQCSRTKEDVYRPYSPERRYKIFSEVNDLGGSPFRVLPSVVEHEWNPNKYISINPAQWVIYYSQSGNSGLGNVAQYLGRLTGIKVSQEMPSAKCILLKTDDAFSVSNSGSQESYLLDVISENETIAITSNTSEAVFWGVQTLLSLMSQNNSNIPEGRIVDYPRFSYRGMHVDVGRNFFPKDSILKLLDVMAMYKLNKFHFHLSDDEGWRLEIPGLPELTKVGAKRCHDPAGDKCIMPQLGALPDSQIPGSGFYTVEDYREILTHAKSLYIEVIPEFDMPGHAHAAINAMKARYRLYKNKNLTKAMEYMLVDLDDTSEYLSVQSFTDNAIDPCIESSYTFVQHVMLEVKKMHHGIQPLKVFNFGGDEVPAKAWINSSACNKEAFEVNKNELKKHFVKRVSAIAASEGLNLAAWEDGFMDKAAQKPFNRSELKNQDVYAYAWDNVWEWGSGSKAYRFANSGYKTVISHATNFYFDHPNEPDPEERGYYWATRWTNTKKVFGYAADNIYENMEYDRMGNLIDKSSICTKYGCPTLEVTENVIGLQGHLWSETVRTSEQFEAMVFPRLLALAERAWHKAHWETEQAESREGKKRNDWNEFSNMLGYRELRRLDAMNISYHLLPPGAKVTKGKMSMNAEFPGLVRQYSNDGGNSWNDFVGETEVRSGSHISLSTSSKDGRLRSRFIKVDVPINSGNQQMYQNHLTVLLGFIINISLRYFC